jgi:hypothetical protein
MALMRSRRPAPRRRPLALAALAAAAGLAGAVAGRRLIQRARSERGRGAPPELWTCACGQAFRVSGVDRHRVHWLVDAPDSEPVLDGRCPRCERPLVADQAA